MEITKADTLKALEHFAAEGSTAQHWQGILDAVSYFETMIEEDEEVDVESDISAVGVSEYAKLMIERGCVGGTCND